MIFWILFSILLLLLLACTAIAWVLYSAMMIRKDTLHYPASADPYAKERLEVQRWNADHLSGCLRIPLRGDSVTLIGYYYPLCPDSKKAGTLRSRLYLRTYRTLGIGGTLPLPGI